MPGEAAAAKKHSDNLWTGVGTPLGRRQRISSRPPTGTTSGFDGFGSNDASVRLLRPTASRHIMLAMNKHNEITVRYLTVTTLCPTIIS